MLTRWVLTILDRSAARQADRLIKTCGVSALEMARHAVRAAREDNRSDFWTRVLAQIEIRSGYRPW